MNIQLPRYDLGQLSHFDLAELDGKPFNFESHGTILPCKLKLLAGSGRLFVMFNGAVDRKKTVIPTFARWNWGRTLGGNVLSICDPTLFLDDELRLGWFLGTSERNPLDTVASIVDAVRQRLRVSVRDIVFYGSSGGGFAAMLAAARQPIGRAIAINPQTSITSYYPVFVDRVARVFHPTWSSDVSSQRCPERWNASYAIRQARASGYDFRLVYAQNLADKGHHRNHYLPFCRDFGLREQGGIASTDGSILTHVYSSPEGHAGEPPDVVKFLTSIGVPHLLNQDDKLN